MMIKKTLLFASVFALTGGVISQCQAQNYLHTLDFKPVTATVTKNAEGIEFIGDPNTSGGASAMAVIPAYQKITVRVLTVPSQKFQYNNFSLVLGTTADPHLEIGGFVDTGPLRGSLWQKDGSGQTVSEIKKDGAPIDNKREFPLEITVDLAAKQITYQINGFVITSPLLIKIPNISRVGFETYHTGAIFRRLEITGTPGSGPVSPPK